MKYDILRYGDQRLRDVARPVAVIDGAIRDLVRDLLDSMYAARGVGLAAEQIGRVEAVAVVHVPSDMDRVGPEGPRLNPHLEMPLVLVNPEITARKGRAVCDEGCLSFPEVSAQIARAEEITFTWLDLSGVKRSGQARATVARAIQHEVDHLNGVLIVNRMSPVKRVSLAGRLKRLRKETLEKLGAV